jgi:hypothetical protein
MVGQSPLRKVPIEKTCGLEGGSCSGFSILLTVELRESRSSDACSWWGMDDTNNTREKSLLKVMEPDSGTHRSMDVTKDI